MASKGVQIDCGIDFLQIEYATRFQDSGKFAQGGLPIGDMVQNPEAKHGIHHRMAVGELHCVPDEQKHFLARFG